MRIVWYSIAFLFLLKDSSDAFAPNGLRATTKPSRMLSLRLDMASPSPTDRAMTSFGKAITTAVTGWFLASQVVNAAVLAPIGSHTDHYHTSSMVVAAKVETLDFSMPDYSSATQSGKPSSSKLTPPSFNPFGDFEPSFKSSSAPDVEVKKAAPTSEPVVTEVPAFKAPDISVPDFKAPSMPDFKAPSMPDFKAPSMPDFKKPEINMPDFKAPSLPDFKAPSLPDFKKPDFNIPDFKAPSLPDFKAPDMPEFKKPDMPDFKAPDMPDFKVPDMPKFNFPKLALPKVTDSEYNLDIPKFDAPDIPKFDVPAMPPMPKIGLPSFGGGESTPSSSSDEDSMFDSQEVRDERAREARQTYLSYDADAKEAEKVAREARNVANEKKKLANQAKDEACKTRPGGKLLCLRNPFTAGY